MNILDIINDARVRAIVERYYALVKIVLRPDHQDAIIEFANINDGGTAAMQLEGHEIAPGRKIRVGTAPEMPKHSAKCRTDKIQVGKKVAIMAQASALTRRPGQPGIGSRGYRGGLGVKRNLLTGLSQDPTAAEKQKDASGAQCAPGAPGNDDEQKKAGAAGTIKSNKDFRAIIAKARSKPEGGDNQTAGTGAHNKTGNTAS